MKPIFKLLTLILLTTLVIRLQGWTLQASVTGLLTLLLGKSLWPRLKPLLPLLLVITAFQGFTGHFLLGVAAALKIINLSLLVLIYTWLTPVNEIAQTFAWLGHKTQLLLTLTFSLVPIILKEWQAISLVQKTRGYRSINPFPVIIPLLHRIFRRAEQLTIVVSSATGEI